MLHCNKKERRPNKNRVVKNLIHPHPLTDVGLCRGSLVCLQGVQGLLCEGEDARWGLHVQQIQGWGGLDEVQISGTGIQRVPIVP